MSTNEYGLDADYFRRKLERVLRDVNSYKPDEMARELARMARTADEEVLRESEFDQKPSLAAVPDERHPVGGGDYGWDGEYNRGWNSCRTAVLAAMLEQAPFTEALPQQGAQEVQPETFRKSDSLWELESSIKDLARQVEGEYRARYYGHAEGFLGGLHMMRVVDAEERNRWKVKILEAHLQAIAQCEAAGEVVPEEIKRREAFNLENLRRIERVTDALQGEEGM